MSNIVNNKKLIRCYLDKLGCSVVTWIGFDFYAVIYYGVQRHNAWPHYFLTINNTNILTVSCL